MASSAVHAVETGLRCRRRSPVFVISAIQGRCMAVHGGAWQCMAVRYQPFFGAGFRSDLRRVWDSKDWKDHWKVTEIQPMTVPTVLSCDDGLGIQMLQIRKSREEVFHFVSHPLLLLWCLGDLGAK